MKLKKYLILTCSILSISMFSQVVTVQASSEYTNDNTEAITEKSSLTEETIARMAIDFANSMKQNLNLKVTELIPIKNSEDNVTGYDCKIRDEDNNDYGYVIITLIDGENFISEFNLEPGTPDFYEIMTEQAEDKNLSIEDDKKELLQVTSTDYALESTTDETFLTNGEIIESTDITDIQKEYEESDNTQSEIIKEAGNYSHVGDIIENYSQSAGKMKYQGQLYLGQFMGITQNRATSSIKKFACTIQSMILVSDRFGYSQSWNDVSLKRDYNRLWSLTNTSNRVENGITFGGTSYNKVGPAWNTYVKEKTNNKKRGSYQYINKPTLSQIESGIKGGHSVLFG